MTDQLENEPTKQLPQLSQEARLTSIETTLTDQQVTLKEINSKLDTLIKMQQDMCVDLRGRFTLLESEVRLFGDEIRQIKHDIQPDSFQNRLMRIGQ